MSAAEKLRALETTLKTDDTEEWEGAMIDLAEAMADALPQLLAVVEAAEEATKAAQAVGGNPAKWNLEVALAALDEKLGEK